MPTASVNRSVDVLVRAMRPHISARSLTADFRPTTETMSIRCSSVLRPAGIGTPPRSTLQTCSWPATACSRKDSKVRPTISLLVTRISAWSSGMPSALGSATSGPIRPILSVRFSVAPPSAMTSPFCSTRSGSAPSCSPPRDTLTMRYSGLGLRNAAMLMPTWAWILQPVGAQAERAVSGKPGAFEILDAEFFLILLRGGLGVDAPPARQVLADQDDADGAPDIGDAVRQRDHAGGILRLHAGRKLDDARGHRLLGRTDCRRHGLRTREHAAGGAGRQREQFRAR